MSRLSRSWIAPQLPRTKISINPTWSLLQVRGNIFFISRSALQLERGFEPRQSKITFSPSMHASCSCAWVSVKIVSLFCSSEESIFKGVNKYVVEGEAESIRNGPGQLKRIKCSLVPFVPMDAELEHSPWFCSTTSGTCRTVSLGHGPHTQQCKGDLKLVCYFAPQLY